ncbi:unnamed protein product [Gadus morhua 'NCC']
MKSQTTELSTSGSTMESQTTELFNSGSIMKSQTTELSTSSSTMESQTTELSNSGSIMKSQTWPLVVSQKKAGRYNIMLLMIPRWRLHLRGGEQRDLLTSDPLTSWIHEFVLTCLPLVPVGGGGGVPFRSLASDRRLEP